MSFERSPLLLARGGHVGEEWTSDMLPPPSGPFRCVRAAMTWDRVIRSMYGVDRGYPS